LALFSFLGVGANRDATPHELKRNVPGCWSATPNAIAEFENSAGKLKRAFIDDSGRHVVELKQQAECQQTKSAKWTCCARVVASDFDFSIRKRRA